MAFEARDLMIDVFPHATRPGELACVTASPPPKPECKAPSCARNSAKAEADEEDSVQLAALPVFRQQLRLALRS